MELIDISEWTPIGDRLPDIGKYVNVACVTILDNNIYGAIYMSTGRRTKYGTSDIAWSIKASESATREKVFDNKVTHWKEI